MTETTSSADDLAALRAETAAQLAAASDLRAWDAVRVGTLGKSGRLTALLKGLGQVPAEQRKERGASLNRLKSELEGAIEARRTALEDAALDARLAAETLDVTLPPRPHPPAGAEAGGIHPISRTREELTAIFGAKISAIVAEVTDDKSLPKAERKRLQIEHARTGSAEAQLVKLADKIVELRDLATRPPAGWSGERKREYFDWCKAVIDTIRDRHVVLAELFDRAYAARP